MMDQPDTRTDIRPQDRAPTPGGASPTTPESLAKRAKRVAVAAAGYAMVVPWT